jgi:hydrogenase nickel incorporation protein HypA/HybF
MHELPVTENLLKVVLEAAEKANAKRVTRINLVVGDLSSIVDDSVQFYFDFLSKDTLAEGAALAFTRLPAEVRCLDCGATSKFAGEFVPTCSRCGGRRLEVSGGREFLVDSIEVE